MRLWGPSLPPNQEVTLVVIINYSSICVAVPLDLELPKGSDLANQGQTCWQPSHLSPIGVSGPRALLVCKTVGVRAQ